MNFQRIYEYRFKGVNPHSKLAIWREIAQFIYRRMGSPSRVLDPAAGQGEFLLSIDATERWAVDLVSQTWFGKVPGVKTIVSNVLTAELPLSYFEGIYVSNFLEHLNSQQEIAQFLERMFSLLRPGGKIAIMGPNFKYCAKEYFDCSDHVIPLSHIAVAEHLYAAGFELEEVTAKFLPYSFRSRLPQTPGLTRLYLQMPWAWNFLGKQFFLIGAKR
jgi:hypothetical protein